MNIKKYMKKPIPVEAEVYRLGIEDGFDTIGVAVTSGLNQHTYEHPKCSAFKGIPYIQTLEGKHYISEGDIIITGVRGERYPCKKDIFLETYEEVKKSSD